MSIEPTLLLVIFSLAYLKNERMVADLAQLHDGVHEGLGAVLAALVVGQDLAPGLHVVVDLALQRRHVALDDVLDLVGQLALHLLLEAPEQERPEHLVQAPDDEQRLLLVQLHLLAGGGEGRVEPLLEGGAGLEDGGQQEVEEGPELGQLVLERRAGEEQAVRRDVGHVERVGELAVVVLHAVALVDDHVLPADLAQARLVPDHVLVGGGDHVELAAADLRLQALARVRVALVDDVDDRGRPPSPSWRAWRAAR